MCSYDPLPALRTQLLRDNFVYMMKHLDESDEVLKYLDDGVSSPAVGHRT